MESPSKLEAVRSCRCCGMHAGPGRSYHPYAACLLFQQTRSSEATQANLAAVVEYGMQAQRAGLTLAEALADVSRVYFSRLPSED